VNRNNARSVTLGSSGNRNSPNTRWVKVGLIYLGLSTAAGEPPGTDRLGEVFNRNRHLSDKHLWNSGRPAQFQAIEHRTQGRGRCVVEFEHQMQSIVVG
jgi:hypothetical protein